MRSPEIPSFDEVVATYNLEVLKKGSDLQLTEEGDLALTDDRDLKLGDDRFNALFRLVERWRFNAPTLEMLFAFVTSATSRRGRIDREVEALGRKQFTPQEFHMLFDSIDATELGREIYAGAIVMVLNNLLQRFKRDLRADDGVWRDTGPFFGGASFGSVLAAAANNFRHHDEWARTEPPSAQQLNSIKIIAAALQRPVAMDGKHHPFRDNVCCSLLRVLSDGDNQRLNRNIFAFAAGLAARL